MDLLILGASGHGRVVKEVAEATGKYNRIDFVDDRSDIAVGKVSDLERLHEIYDSAFAGIGDNHLRNELIHKLKTIGYEIPVFIHPTAYVSKNCHLEKGTIVEPQAIVNANTQVGVGCIISIGAIVDHDVILGDCVHVNAGAIVKAGGKVESEKKLEAGGMVLVYQERVVKPVVEATVEPTVKSMVEPADSNSDFAKEYREATGKEVSFF
ncbi:hypothetical protein ABXS75_00770 [Roseburia hominis]